jgi:hypothetical protein
MPINPNPKAGSQKDRKNKALSLPVMAGSQVSSSPGLGPELARAYDFYQILERHDGWR